MRGMKGICAGICILLLPALLACGRAQEDGNTPAETVSQPETAQLTQAPVTEEDYRNAISSASGEEKIALYRDFCANYIMSEEEYRDYAGLLADAGDSLSARDVLFMLYRSDPSEEHGELLAAQSVEMTGENHPEAEEVLARLTESLEKLGTDDFSADEIRELLASDEWKDTFYIDNGTFTSHTEVSGGRLSASVDSDSLSTKVLLTTSDEGFLLHVTPAHLSAGRRGNADDSYVYRSIGADGVDIVSVTGYAKEGHYVNQLDLTVDGLLYQGSFDDAGKTKEEQPEGVNGTVYAYSDDQSRYLYAEGVSPDNFVATPDALGFETF